MQPEETVGRQAGGEALLDDEADTEEPLVDEAPALRSSRMIDSWRHRTLIGLAALASIGGALVAYGRGAADGRLMGETRPSAAISLSSGGNESAGGNTTEYNDEDKYPNGHDTCPCVGILGRPGEYYYPYGERNVSSNHGSYCNTWDLENAHCKNNAHDLCHSKWCYVDPCNCKGLEQPPKPYAHLTFQGKPAYWSYYTCGHTFDWDESVHGSLKDLQDQADKDCKAPLDEKKYGKKECQCRGFAGMHGTLPYDDEMGETFVGTADTGSLCKAWDKTQHPECLYLPVFGQGAENATFPEWCEKPWCYVDPCQCDVKAIGAEPQPSMFDAIYATSGAPLYWSYATCGVENAYSDAQKLPSDLCDPESLKNRLNGATLKAEGNSAPAALRSGLGVGLLLVGLTELAGSPPAVP